MTAPEAPKEYPQQQVPQYPSQYWQDPTPQHQQYPPQQYQQYQQYQQPVATSNGMGITGFVTGLLGLVFFWVPFFGIVLGILGIVFSGAGFQSFRKRGQTNGLAIAGLVLGIITVAIYVIFAIAIASWGVTTYSH